MRNILTLILLAGLTSCSDTEYYEVQFENVDRLTEGDKVILKGLVIGNVKDLKIDDENKVLATIQVGRTVKVTKGSSFIIRSELLGTRYVEIDLADEKELMNSNEIQKGITQLSPDTTDQLKLTRQEKDTLVKHFLTPYIKSENEDTVSSEDR